MEQGNTKAKARAQSIDDIVKDLSRPENMESLEELVDALPSIKKTVVLLEQLEQMGALETLFSLACAIASSKNMLSDEMVAGAASLGSSAIELLAKLSSPEFQSILSVLFEHSVELSQAMNKASRIRGVVGLFREMRDPEVQKGLGAIFAFLKLFGKYIGTSELQEGVLKQV